MLQRQCTLELQRTQAGRAQGSHSAQAAAGCSGWPTSPAMDRIDVRWGRRETQKLRMLGLGCLDPSKILSACPKYLPPSSRVNVRVARMFVFALQPPGLQQPTAPVLYAPPFISPRAQECNLLAHPFSLSACCWAAWTRRKKHFRIQICIAGTGRG